MQDLLSKCGANCGRCPSYRENLITDEDRQRCSAGWQKYHGFRLRPEKLLRCDGCPMPISENPVRYYKHGCRIRKCAVFNGAETCAHCSAYPCGAIQHHLVWAEEREERIAQLGETIPEEDYLSFMEPYDSRKYLEAIRASLAPGDIVEVTKVSVRSRIVDFPDDLPFSEEETSAYETLHRILAEAGTADGISYAQQLVLKTRRQHLLKILWAFGRFGRFEEEGGPHLVLDSETYLAQKIHSGHSRVRSYFEALGEYGVHGAVVPLVEEGWLTPTGGLRKRGWFMKMFFGDDAGGVPVLKALQSYVAKLDEEYDRGAFRYFAKADMRVLSGG